MMIVKFWSRAKVPQGRIRVYNQILYLLNGMPQKRTNQLLIVGNKPQGPIPRNPKVRLVSVKCLRLHMEEAALLHLQLLSEN